LPPPGIGEADDCFWDSFPTESGRTLSSMTISPSEPGESGADDEMGSTSRQAFLALVSPLVLTTTAAGLWLLVGGDGPSRGLFTPAMDTVYPTGGAPAGAEDDPVVATENGGSSFLISSTILFLT
jgi:hypothetical protein